MAEALAVVSVVANIVQLIDFGSKVSHRLNDFQSSRGEIPKTFKHIKDELPILLETLNQTKVVAEKGSMREETKNALLLVVNGCQTQITLLGSLISSLLPEEGDSWGKKTSKAILSLREDTKVATITTILRTHIQSLTNYHVTASSVLQTVTAQDAAGIALAEASSPSIEAVPNPRKAGIQCTGESSVNASMTNITRSFQESTPSGISTDFAQSVSFWDKQSSTSLTAATDLSFSSSGPAGPHPSPENGFRVIIRVEVDSIGSHQEIIDTREYDPFQAVYEGILRVRNIILVRETLESVLYNGSPVNSFILASGAQDHTFAFNSTFLKAVLEQFEDKYYTSIAIGARFSGTPISSRNAVQRDLFAKLEAAKVLGADGQFVPLDRIKEIITTKRIQNLFLEYYNHFDIPSQLCEMSGLANQYAPKLLATFILACIESLVPKFMAFLENGFSDSSMPLDCSQLPLFCRRGDYDLICATQPQTLVAEISLCADDVSIQAFSCQYRLPFIERSLIGTGGFSRVFKVTLDTQESGRSSFAIKQLNSHSKHAFLCEFEALRALLPLKHPHLINLLGSFEYCGRYHLMFPVASGSLRSLLIQYDPRRDRSLIRWMLRQLSGIADGLHHFHTLPVKRDIVHVPLPGQGSSISLAVQEEEVHTMISYHGDIKPANILWFKSEGVELGTLQIADFGLGRFHGRFNFYGRTNFHGTMSYSAPECDIRYQKPSLGSAYDIWSFGGILSEVVAWILGGPLEVEGFRTERKGHVFLRPNLMILAAPFYYYERGKFSISPAVDRRLEAMIKRAVEVFGPSGSKSADQVVDLIKACLIIDPCLRPAARVVADRLKEISESFEVTKEFDAQGLESQGIRRL